MATFQPVDTFESVTKLRELMKQRDIQAYLIFSEDAHQSEYIADCDKRREFISGFSGSAGYAAVTMAECALWTDGRYFLQASQQLDANWKLMKQLMPETPTLSGWLNQILPPNSKVGVDPKLVSYGAAKSLKESLESKGNSLVPLNENLIDLIWTNKPGPSQNPVFVHSIQYSGKTHSSKITELRKQLDKEGAFAYIVCALDEVAWLFNLRGSDVEYNPVFMSYAIVTKQECNLYINKSKLNEEITKHLGPEVTIKDYEGVFDDLTALNNQTQKVWIDSSKISLALFNSLSSNPSLAIDKSSPISLPKALKNDAELEGLRQCHLRDAVALISFLSWLEERLEVGDDTLDEYTVAQKLDKFRSEQKDFVSLSFPTISCIGPNGAIIHYKPESDTAAKIQKQLLYLVDSGGQYKDGTTDVTRTVHFGTPTEHQKKCFTRVLQGVIALDSVVFPTGTTGRELDILARMSLWQLGLDYRHGTGHGVGAFLNVHEGPQGISFRDPVVKVPLQPGMTVTDEPGYYEDGNFGIRIENVLCVKEAQTEFNFGGKGYLSFDHLTYVPIQTKMMDTSIMTHKEIKWVNDYHQQCLEKLSPLVQNKHVLQYLIRETQPIKIN